VNTAVLGGNGREPLLVKRNDVETDAQDKDEQRYDVAAVGGPPGGSPATTGATRH